MQVLVINWCPHKGAKSERLLEWGCTLLGKHSIEAEIMQIGKNMA